MFFRFETVKQDVENVKITNATEFNQNLALFDSTELPTIQGALANGEVVANGFIINNNTGTGTNDLTVAMISGSFGNQVTSTINLINSTGQLILESFGISFTY